MIKASSQKMLLLTAVFFLTACVTTQKAITPTLEYSKFNFGEGMGFTKNGFNLQGFAERSNICYSSTTNVSLSNTTPQQDRYKNCMSIGKYKLTRLSNGAIEKRKKAHYKYKEERTPGEGKFFNKENFNYEGFANTALACAKKNKNVDFHSPAAPYGSGIGGALVYSLRGGYNKSKKQQAYTRLCMIKEGYIYEKMPQGEIDKRLQAIRNLRNN